MKLSILMPSFNQARFINKALQSIFAQMQGLELDLEVLIMDARSTDGTQEVLKPWLDRYPHIIFDSEPDGGPADALNKALARSSGDLIGWLNCDDEYLPGAFASILNCFNASPQMVMAYGHGQWIDIDGRVLGRYPTEQPHVPIDRFQRGCFIHQPSVFMRRSLFDRVGGFNIEYRSAFDLELWLRVFYRYQEEIGFVDQLLASTRIHDATISSTQRRMGSLEAMRALNQHLGYAEANWARSYLNEFKQTCPDSDVFNRHAQVYLSDAATYCAETELQPLRKEFCVQSHAIPPASQGAVPRLPWLCRLIYAARHDLRSKMPINTLEGYWLYCAWVVRSALNANRQLLADPEFLLFCKNTQWPTTQLNLAQACIYQSSAALQAQFPLPEGEERFRAWLAQNRTKPVLQNFDILLTAIESVDAEALPMIQRWALNVQASSQHPYGINVIGYVQSQMGIGEDARTTFDALKAKGFNCALINFKPGDPIAQNVHTHDEHLVSHGPYSINVICLPATELVRYTVTEGASQMLGRYNIGYWPWELNGWPKPWTIIDELVDEVWVASRFIRDSIGSAVRKPIKVVPLHVPLGPVSPLTRRDFGLPEAAKLFCFSFDLNSSIHRKNPQDCLRLFLESFPREQGWTKEQVGLVIKTFKPAVESEEWRALKALAAKDDRIWVFEQSFNKPDLLALYNNCDCFLSLHRAEGYGRNIAEVILLGLEVVTTGYSGNLDFCRPPQCTLVECELVPVQPGQYPDGEGFSWAGNFKLPKLDAVRRRFRAGSMLT